MTESLEERICRHEGFCGFPKYDAKGMWVVGFGHDLTEEQAKDYLQGIGMDQALDFLKADIGKAITSCDAALPWLADLDEQRRNVVYEMAFQLGVNGVLAFNHMLQHLRGGDYADAAREMLESLWHQQTPNRCEELAEIMIGGVA